jgi:hypothetical protein
MNRAERRSAASFAALPSRLVHAVAGVGPAPTPIDVGDMRRGEKGEGGVTEVTPKKGRQRVRDWQSAFLHLVSEQGNVSRA